MSSFQICCFYIKQCTRAYAKKILGLAPRYRRSGTPRVFARRRAKTCRFLFFFYFFVRVFESSLLREEVTRHYIYVRKWRGKFMKLLVDFLWDEILLSKFVLSSSFIAHLSKEACLASCRHILLSSRLWRYRAAMKPQL